MYQCRVMVVVEGRISHLKECLGPGSSSLQHDGEDGEDDDLDGGSASIPIWSTDAEL